MLDRVDRMRDAGSFRATIRGGVKGTSSTLVVHALRPADSSRRSVGFVVSKAVGSAVDRNRVKRRLRHIVRDRLEAMPVGTHVVVRALPSARNASSASLVSDFDRCTRRLDERHWGSL